MGIEQTMRERSRMAKDQGAQLLLGLLGTGIQRSLSPALHMAEARAQGLAVHYQLIDLDGENATAASLKAVMRTAQELGFAGLNVTYPFKQLVMPLLDELSQSARDMGAVNTVVFGKTDQKLSGHNTDGSGWRSGFERDLPNADLSRVVLLGAGGAGSAIAHTLCNMGCRHIVLVDTDTKRADALAQDIRHKPHTSTVTTTVTTSTNPALALQGASGLVHATPTGMDKLPGLPLKAELLHSGLWVSEVVYFPLNTELLRTARALGCQVSDGGGMAVGQALGAFALFTGLQANAARVRSHFEALVNAQA